MVRVRIYGLDFTSAPSKRKPLILVGCALEGHALSLEEAEALSSFDEFEGFLERGEPWVCGMDFPFGQPRALVEALGWPRSWEGYVGKVSRLPKEEFERAIKNQWPGDRWVASTTTVWRTGDRGRAAR